MQKKLLIILLFIIPSIAMSQVSLNASMAPPINSMVIYYDANVPSPPFTYGTSGTTNTWDFTGIAAVPGADDTTFVVSPAAVPGGTAFPTATHCTYEAGDNSLTVMQIDASGITLLGNIGDISGSGIMTPITLMPPLQVMTFPYVYGSGGTGSGYFYLTGSGAFFGIPTVDSVIYKSDITGQVDVIASGTIVLPSGSMDAILERNIHTTIDSVWIKSAATLNQWIIAPTFPMTSTDSSFYWYTNNSLLPYAHALYDDTGLHDVNYYKQTAIVGISETKQPLAGNVYPNPVSDVMNLTVPENFKGHCNLQLINSQGQYVMQGNTDLHRINVSYLQPGVYFLNLTDAEGKTVTMKFIKN